MVGLEKHFGVTFVCWSGFPPDSEKAPQVTLSGKAIFELSDNGLFY